MADHRIEPRMPGNYKYKWTDEAVKQLICYRHERRHLFTRKRFSAQKGWALITRDMNLEGLISPELINKKWNNLVQKYRELKIFANQGGENEMHARAWPFYDLMDSVMNYSEDDHATTQHQVISDESNLNDDDVEAPEYAAGSMGDLSDVDDPPRPPPKRAKVDDDIIEWIKYQDQKIDEHLATIERQGEMFIQLFGELVDVLKNR